VLHNVMRVAHEHASRHDTCASSNAVSRTRKRCAPAAMLEAPTHDIGVSVPWCHLGYRPMRWPTSELGRNPSDKNREK
jgi:hypothetical protein